MVTIEKEKAAKGKEKNLQECLKKSSLFGDLTAKELEELARYCKYVHKPKGSVIYRKDDLANQLYLIQSGYVMESVYYGSSLDVMIKVREPGEYIGEMGILSEKPYPNTSFALEDTWLIAIPRTCFLDLVWNNVKVCRVIIRQLIERLTNSSRNMVHSMYLDAPGRLAFTLLNLTANTNQKSMQVRVTQGALAASSGMARQTAAKILGQWRTSGWISTERGRISVQDFEALSEIILNSEINA